MWLKVFEVFKGTNVFQTPGVLTCVFDEGACSDVVADLEGIAVKDTTVCRRLQINGGVWGRNAPCVSRQQLRLFCVRSHVWDVTSIPEHEKNGSHPPLCVRKTHSSPITLLNNPLPCQFPFRIIHRLMLSSVYKQAFLYPYKEY